MAGILVETVGNLDEQSQRLYFDKLKILVKVGYCNGKLT